MTIRCDDGVWREPDEVGATEDLENAGYHLFAGPQPSMEWRASQAEYLTRRARGIRNGTWKGKAPKS